MEQTSGGCASTDSRSFDHKMSESSYVTIDPLYSAFLRGELDELLEDGWYEIDLIQFDVAA